MRRVLLAITVVVLLLTPSTPAVGAVGVGVTLTPESWNFGGQAVGTSSPPKTFTFSNASGVPVTVTSVFTGSATLAVDGSDCTAAPVPNSGSCTISVTYTPVDGSRISTYLYIDSSAGLKQSSISGDGVVLLGEIAPTDHPFDDQLVGTQSSQFDFTLTNQGDTPLTYGISTGGTDVGDFVLAAGADPSCSLGGGSLGIGSSCNIGVAFRPQTSGAKSATLVVTRADDGGTHTSDLTGTGTFNSISATPPAKDFGDQVAGTTSASQTVTITNDGTSDFSVTAIDLNGTDADEFAVDVTNCTPSLDLDPTETCSVDVTFSPDSLGAKEASLDITTDGPPALNVALDGNGASGTTIDALSVKRSKRRMTATFSSTPAGQTFECKIDNEAFSSCTSPYVRRLKVGTHTLSVKATGDATPAERTFKVMRPRS